MTLGAADPGRESSQQRHQGRTLTGAGIGKMFEMKQTGLDVIGFRNGQRHMRRKPETLREKHQQQEQRRDLRHTDS